MTKSKGKTLEELEKDYGENNSGHYNYFIIDREIIFVTTKDKKNVPSALKLSLEAIGLYTIIKAHGINKDFAWPSLATLAKYSNKSINTIQKYLSELIDAGLIIKDKKFNEHGGHPNNVYIIPAIDKENLAMASIYQNLIVDKNSQLSKSDICENDQLSKSDNGNCQNAVEINYQNLTSKENNINIINELRIKAQLDVLNPVIEKRLKELVNAIVSENGRIYLSGDVLIIKYQYDISIKRELNVILDSIGLFEKINVIYEK